MSLLTPKLSFATAKPIVCNRQTYRLQPPNLSFATAKPMGCNLTVSLITEKWLVQRYFERFTRRGKLEGWKDGRIKNGLYSQHDFVSRPNCCKISEDS